MVKKSDNMTQWLKFFLKGVVETSKNSIKTFDRIIELKKLAENKLSKIGKKAINGKRLLELLYSKPKVNAKIVAQELEISVVSANSLLKTFVEIGILEEKTGFNRNRFYIFEDYIKLFR
jgi:Fic family protein